MNYIILLAVIIAVILAFIPGRTGRKMSFDSNYSWQGKGRDDA